MDWVGKRYRLSEIEKDKDLQHKNNYCHNCEEEVVTGSLCQFKYWDKYDR